MTDTKLSERMRKLGEFNSEQNDEALVRSKWPGAPGSSSDYYTRGRLSQHDRLRPLIEIGVRAVEALSYLECPFCNGSGEHICHDVDEPTSIDCMHKSCAARFRAEAEALVAKMEVERGSR